MAIGRRLQRHRTDPNHDGKIDLNRLEHVGALNDTTKVYAKAVYANFLKRVIYVVMLKSNSGDKTVMHCCIQQTQN
ncbi:hypothetical protein FIU95_14125 [Microbulbifer sp. THAF38]|nr:hypothetical protein FIU95_14125 [Microbulbifer sp. THAF38]